MIALTISADVTRATMALQAAARTQIPFATAKALTALAKQAQAAEQAALPQVFSHLSPFTRQGIAIEPATKGKPQACVYVRDLQAKYLATEEFGGTRTSSLNTRIISRALSMPGVGARLNKAGGLPRGYIKSLAARAQADKEKRADAQAGNRKMPKRDGGVFIMSGHGPSGGPGGIFQRLPGHHLTRLISFESEAHYTAKFGFEPRAIAVVRQNGRAVFDAALKQAFATQR